MGRSGRLASVFRPFVRFLPDDKALPAAGLQTKGPIRIQNAAIFPLLKDRPSILRCDGPFQNKPLSHGAHAAGRSVCPAEKPNTGAFSSGVPGMTFSV